MGFLNTATLLSIALIWAYDAAAFNTNSIAFGELGTSKPSTGKYSVPPLKFQQKVDHFDTLDLRRFDQKYFVSDKFYKPGGPVFVFIGNEGPTNPDYVDADRDPLYDMMKNAKHFNAMAFLLEHRFYGESNPVDPTPENIVRYLNTKQALGDLAEFILFVKEKYNVADAPVVTFGRSYGGSLSAWFRLKYPHLAVGAVASSAPLQLLVTWPNTTEQQSMLRKSLQAYNSRCYSNVELISKTIRKLLDTADGRIALKQKLNLCHEVNDQITNKEKQSLINLPYLMVARDMKGSCDYIANTRNGIPATEKFWILMGKVAAGECVDYSYQNYIHQTRNLLRSGPLQQIEVWIFQACTELIGWFYPFDEQTCFDVFQGITHDTLETTAFETNEFYGSKDIKGTEIAFPNGSADIWHYLGLLESDNPSRIAIYMQGTQHAQDTLPADPSDPEELTKGREKITAAIDQFLKTPTAK